VKNSYQKIDISRNLSKKSGYSNLFSKELIDTLLKILINNIKTGQLNLKNFGSFKLVNKSQRIGRNPKTKEKFIISARKVIKFIPSKKIKIFINKNNG
tara:strand:+ start:179 stop:472 length:294 start_codon:yes stop_codon:yes gene_type:complete